MKKDKNIINELDKKMDFFFKYFPARIKNVGEDAIAARKLIWAFKDGRDNADEKVAELAAKHIIEEYGDQLDDMAIVCMPTSKKESYTSRFMNFCKKVCTLTGMENGFPHIVIMKSRPAVHEHRRGKRKCEVAPSVVDYDTKFFKGKKVLVFDDVITTGQSFAAFVAELEHKGAEVVGGMFIGKTYYKYA